MSNEIEKDLADRWHNRTQALLSQIYHCCCYGRYNIPYVTYDEDVILRGVKLFWTKPQSSARMILPTMT